VLLQRFLAAYGILRHAKVCPPSVLDLRWRPRYAYVPGSTQRHAEDLFDRFKPDASMPEELLSRCTAWHLGLQFFGEGFYWEAHEMWEAIWLRLGQTTPERAMVQSLIQLANTGLKVKIGRPKAQERLLGLARQARPDAALLPLMGVTLEQWQSLRTQVSTPV
jgi:hypothetical protein